ncbi:GNAT family N-acetyltransferase [Inhella gelatinilytica]|uniref:GNAT family N-acetyltransferase n=1 Tax=Inhella gelatinilytica TaxID=2795030 RepID=A0A931J185_9BURK|nr:GNAT family protein [Inhella gelatinilytica]MBH9554278.1 GNAT family N-acetyltransferase [Inhella gelatinilytica]
MAAPSVRLRPTMLSDLEWVVGVEQDGANRPFITPWERPQHEGAIRFPDSRHFIVESSDQVRLGFVILQGCRNPNGSLELKRLVLAPGTQGQGLGRTCLRALKALAFQQFKAHRFWLDVKAMNERAHQLYLSEGFVEEGRLRESVRVAGAEGFDSLIVMSMLDREFQARLAMGQEKGA